MGALIDILIDFGYWGMLAAAFLAGSFFPFSSEAVMTALVAVGLDPVQLTIYGVGRMGRLDWIEKYLHVSKESLDKATKFMGGHGAWMGFFAFVPILGSAITICLGLMRANIIISVISITLGKFIRYAILAYILMCGQTMLA